MYLFSYFAFREGGIRILLSYCNRSRERNNVSDHVSLKVPTEIRILALRSLGAICCVAECIRQFETVSGDTIWIVVVTNLLGRVCMIIFICTLQCDGLQVIDDLLSGRHSTVEDRVESAAVLAQITSPWISDNHKIHNLDLHVMSMVMALTGTCWDDNISIAWYPYDIIWLLYDQH